jgi:AAA15 family ATPase/GTPase
MINSLSVKNFKGIRSLELSELAPVTLLGGMNNIGKSSVLDALFLLYTAPFPDLFTRQYNLREMNVGNFDNERIWSNFFYNLDTSNFIKIETSSVNISHRIICNIIQNYSTINASSIETKSNINVGINKNVRFGSVLSVSFFVDGLETYNAYIYRNNEGLFFPIVNRSNENHSSPLVDLIFLRPMRSRAINSQWLSEMDVENKLELVINMMKEIEPRIKSLSVVPASPMNEIYADIGLKRKIPLKLLGDGISHLLSFILAIANTPKGIVLIDEIENGLHYSIQPKIWEFLMQLVKKFECQVIATTHSYGMLQAAHETFKESDIENFRYIRLEKNDEGIQGVNFSSKQLDTALKFNMEVR